MIFLLSALTKGHVLLHVDGEVVVSSQGDAIVPEGLSRLHGCRVTFGLWLWRLVLRGQGGREGDGRAYRIIGFYYMARLHYVECAVPLNVAPQRSHI